MAEKQVDWVNFEEIKAKIGFEEVLAHFGIWGGIDREGETLGGPCRMCQADGFKINLEKKTFSCPGCKKRGSVIDFVSAYKKVGLKEAGTILQGILAQGKKRETAASRQARRRKVRLGKKEESPPPASSPISDKGNPEVVPTAAKAEILDILGNINVRIKEIADMTERVKLKLEGKG
jgi:hypothetical protein